MTDRPEDHQPITYDDDIQDLDLTPEQGDRFEHNLEGDESSENVPWSPPQQRPLGAILADEGDDRHETIEQRILQEEPEMGTAYGAPESGEDARKERGELEPDDQT